MKKIKVELCVLLSFALVITSIALGFGGFKANAYDNYPATGVFKLEICTKDKTIMYPAPGSDSDFEFRLLNADRQILWQSGTLDTPANDFEEGNIDIFTAQNGNPALGAVPVSKDIYYFEIIETRHNDSWFMNWLDVYYLIGTEWVQVGHNGGDYELDHVGDHVMWATTWFADHAHTLNFNTNGGTNGATYDAVYGQPLTAPSSSRTGYTLTGWSPSVPAIMPDSNATYTAQWTGNTYTVNFLANGTGAGTPSPTSKTVTYGSTYGTLATTSRTGYTFNGWYTAASGGTIIESTTTVTITANQTLYAQWTGNTYTVTFDANGGIFPETGNGNPIVYSMFYGDYIFPPAVTKAGCCFSGWSSDIPKYVPASDETYTAQWRTVGYEAGNAFLFGEYPQSVIRDTSLLLELRECELDENGIATYENERYLRVCFEQYTPYYLTLDPTEENSFQDNNGFYATAEYWFKYEPIQWRVLSNTNGEVFAVAETILDSSPFSPSAGEWVGSTVRTWLNDSFAGRAFLPDEWARINSSEVLIPANPVLGTPGGTATQDKLFFLSYEDAMDSSNGFTGSADSDANRRAGVTDYARCMGLLEEEQTYGHGLWWLRSPGFSSTEAGVVTVTGSILAQDSYHAAYTCVGIRPAMRIDARALILFSVKGSGCVINYGEKFIYGLSPGITTLDGYAATAEGYVLEYVPTSEGFGTGTIVHVKKDGVAVDSYTIIIFGDVNGDGNIDSADAGIAVDYENYMIDWDSVEDAAYLLAGDVNGDGNVDSTDAGIMVDCENYLVSIDQTTGLADTD